MRLYNGAPDDELKALWDSRDQARATLDREVKKLFGENARGKITYFPMEQKYSACMFIGHKYVELTDHFSCTVEDCAAKALKVLRRTTSD